MKISKITRLLHTSYGLDELKSLLQRWENRGKVPSNDGIKDLQDFLESAGISFTALQEAQSERETKLSTIGTLRGQAADLTMNAIRFVDKVMTKMADRIAKLEAKIASIRAKAQAKANAKTANAEAKGYELQVKADSIRAEVDELTEVIDLLS